MSKYTENGNTANADKMGESSPPSQTPNTNLKLLDGTRFQCTLLKRSLPVRHADSQ